MCVAHDETERKQLQDDKDGWIAQVSHELRTPLTPIKGFLHTLQRRDDQLERGRSPAHLRGDAPRGAAAREPGERAPAGHHDRRRELALDPEPVDWRSLVAEQVELYQRSDPERSVVAVIDPAIDQVVVDRTLATGVLANLLSNALKYSPEGSPIEVRSIVEGRDLVTSVSDSRPRRGARGPGADLRQVHPAGRPPDPAPAGHRPRPLHRPPVARAAGRRDLVRRRGRAAAPASPSGSRSSPLRHRRRRAAVLTAR